MRHQLEHLQKPLQKLILSREMQRALTLLQLPVLELSTLIAAEIEQNPLLEYIDDELPFSFEEDFRKETHGMQKEESDHKSFLENALAEECSLFDHLLTQASEKFSDKKDLHLAKMIIGNLDECGFLNVTLDEIAFLAKCSITDLEPILKEIQTFDPSGVGAKNLQESLLIQLKMKGKEKGIAYKIIENHFEDMLKNRLPLIAKQFSLQPQKIKEIIEKEIAHLNLHPGQNLAHSHYKEMIQYITPDVTITDELKVEVNEEKIPPLRFNSKYLSLLEDKTIPLETKDYIKSKLISGKWLLRNLYERNATIFRITQEIVKKQNNFFLTAQGKLIPFTMKEVSTLLELHESTIVRAVSNKYVSSPRGIYPLRFFFTHGILTEKGEDISPHTIQDTIQEIISGENKKSPLSDEDIAALLKSKGFTCARRTVAKYRVQLNIGNTTERKRH